MDMTSCDLSFFPVIIMFSEVTSSMAGRIKELNYQADSDKNAWSGELDYWIPFHGLKSATRVPEISTAQHCGPLQRVIL
jgi:hypothetical protein